MSRMNGGTRVLCLFLTFTALVGACYAQTFNSIFSFNGIDGQSPGSALVEGTDGSLYGTTLRGGLSQSFEGTAFDFLIPGDHLNTLHSFCVQPSCLDGMSPSGLVEGIDGNFYGTTQAGGVNGFGTVFQISASGELTVLYAFCCDGGFPSAGLILGTDRSLYGTTASGGANNQGTIFKITMSGELTTLYSFCSQANCADGATPMTPLTLAKDGYLYGATSVGGNGAGCTLPGGCGTVFRVTPSGKLTTLYSFCSQTNCTDGIRPSGLTQANTGLFYGTTISGGSTGFGTLFSVSRSGDFSTLHSFCTQPECDDGAAPESGVVQAIDQFLYVTTGRGGIYGGGTIFKSDVHGNGFQVYSFCAQPDCADGYGQRQP